MPTNSGSSTGKGASGLAVRLALLASVLVVLAAGAVGLTLTRAAAGDLQAELEDRGLAIARGVAARAHQALADGDRRALAAILDTLWQEDDIAAVELLGPTGRPLAARRFAAAPGAPFKYPVTGEPDAEGYREAVGMVQVTLSRARLEARRAAYTRRALVVTGAVAAAGVLLAAGFGLAMAAPLRRLAKASAQAASGDYGAATEVPVAGPREVRALGEAFRAAVGAVARRETDLRTANDALNAANAALSEANEALRRTEQARDAMTHMLVHDLKGPLGNVVTLLTVLETADLDAEDRDLLAEGKDRCRALLQRVEDLLDVARMEHGRISLHLEPVPASRLFGESIEAIRRLAAERGFTLEAPPGDDVAVLCDRRLMERVLQNLMLNAVRHGRPPVRVVASSEADEVVLAVDDAGAGVPAGREARVFEPFASFAPDGRRKGAGLGLAFVRLATEAHGGRVAVRGARFELRFPRRAFA
jgi:signal transduction histidine kinase